MHNFTENRAIHLTQATKTDKNIDYKRQKHKQQKQHMIMITITLSTIHIILIIGAIVLITASLATIIYHTRSLKLMAKLQ